MINKLDSDCSKIYISCTNYNSEMNFKFYQLQFPALINYSRRFKVP